MQNSESSSLFFDLDAALQRGSSGKPAAMLRQLTDLLLSEAERLDKEHIRVFDDVLIRLTTAELVGIANTMSQDHPLAISKRARLEVALTDLLLDRGNEAVFNSVAGNFGASFSEAGFAVLLKSVRAIVAPAAVNEPRETEARA